MMIRTGFGEALRIVRLHRGLTQEDFALVSSRTYVSSLERGHKSPTIDKVIQLSSVMQIHPIVLLALAHAKGQSPTAAARLLRDLADQCEGLRLNRTK